MHRAVANGVTVLHRFNWHMDLSALGSGSRKDCIASVQLAYGLECI